MTVYASLAASLVFGSNDRLWTVLTEESQMKRGVFHLSAGMAGAVQLVPLPFLPSRYLPGMLAEQNIDSLLKQTGDSRQQFLESLTKQELVLVEALLAHPYASNEEIAGYLSKSEKTIEKQISGIYVKLGYYYETNVEDRRKRQILMDVLGGRI